MAWTARRDAPEQEPFAKDVRSIPLEKGVLSGRQPEVRVPAPSLW